MTRLLGCVAMLALVQAPPAPSPCPSPDVSDYPGAWKSRAGYVGGSRFAAPRGSYDRAAAGATLDTLLKLLQGAYPEPRGGMAYFEKHLLFSAPDRDLPFGYSLYVGHTGFRCTSANRLVESVESGVSVTIHVNEFSTLLSKLTAPSVSTSGGELTFNADEDGNYRVGGRPVYLIPSVHERHEGADRYATASRANRGGAPTEQFLVVRREDRPIVTYVTRRDYLQQFRRELEVYTSREIEGSRATAGLPGASTADWQASFVRGMGAYVAAVDAYLRNAPADDLARPVTGLLTHFPIDLENPRLKFAEGDYHLAYLNPDHRDRTLPHHVPQFIVVRWTIKDTTTPATWEMRFRDHISDRLDVAALRALIRTP